jgi:hypothetical protein
MVANYNYCHPLDERNPSSLSKSNKLVNEMQETQTTRSIVVHEKPWPLGEDYCPTHLDVSCGRGKTNWNHAGNTMFRKLIKKNVDRYFSAASKADKTTLIVAIVEKIRQRGGLFVKNDNGKNWYDIGNRQAREKVGHSLRDQVASMVKNKRQNHMSTSGSREHDLSPIPFDVPSSIKTPELGPPFNSGLQSTADRDSPTLADTHRFLANAEQDFLDPIPITDNFYNLDYDTRVEFHVPCCRMNRLQSPHNNITPASRSGVRESVPSKDYYLANGDYPFSLPSFKHPTFNFSAIKDLEPFDIFYKHSSVGHYSEVI